VELDNMCSSPEIIRMIKKRMVRVAGHAAHGENRNTFVKKRHSTTQEEEPPVTWNTQAHIWDHRLKINNRRTAVSATIILNT
jgi:hypothetical protein